MSLLWLFLEQSTSLEQIIIKLLLKMSILCIKVKNILKFNYSSTLFEQAENRLSVTYIKETNSQSFSINLLTNNHNA